MGDRARAAGFITLFLTLTILGLDTGIKFIPLGSIEFTVDSITRHTKRCSRGRGGRKRNCRGGVYYIVTSGEKKYTVTESLTQGKTYKGVQCGLIPWPRRRIKNAKEVE